MSGLRGREGDAADAGSSVVAGMTIESRCDPYCRSHRPGGTCDCPPPRPITDEMIDAALAVLRPLVSVRPTFKPLPEATQREHVRQALMAALVGEQQR